MPEIYQKINNIERVSTVVRDPCRVQYQSYTHDTGGQL